MAQKDSVLFRNSVNGFNKADVNAYILKLNAELEAAELKAKDARDTLDLAKKEADDAKSELDTALLRLAEQDSITAALYETIDSLKEEIAALKESASAKKEEEDYEEVSAKIGSVLIEARSNADKIVADARAEADMIVANAQSAIAKRSDKALGAITRELCGGVDGCYKEATAYMNALQLEVNRLLSDFSGKNKEMNEKIKALHASLSRSISTEVNSMSGCITPYIAPTDKNKKESV